MQYLGSKRLISKRLADFIISQKPADFSGKVFEPFFGSGAVTYALMQKGFEAQYFASDAHTDLILMYEAIKGGWVPPYINESEYNQLKAAKPSPERGFAGFGLSFGGKFFGGFARNRTGYDYCKGAINSLERQRVYTERVNFYNLSYKGLVIPPGSIVYCDPPYSDTTKYTGDAFRADEFWQWVRGVSKISVVLVSEYKAPDDFTCVYEVETKLNLRSKEGGAEVRTEKVFAHMR